MSLKTVAQSAITQAFAFLKAQELVVSARLIINSEPQVGVNYDPVTGTVSRDHEVVVDVEEAVQVEFEERLVDGEKIQRGDKQLIFPTAALQGHGIAPGMVRVTFSDGSEWRVIKPSTDPITALATLHIRR